MQFLPCPSSLSQALSRPAIVLIRRPLQPDRVIAREAAVEIGRRIFSRGNVPQKVDLGEHERRLSAIFDIHIRERFISLKEISFV